MTEHDNDQECPRCGEMTFQKGTLLVGGAPGGPLRFEFDSATVVKVRSRACRSCGFIDFWLNAQELKKKHSALFESRLKHLCEQKIGEIADNITEGDIFIPLDAFPTSEEDWDDYPCTIRIDLLREIAQEYTNSMLFKDERYWRDRSGSVRFDKKSQGFVGKWKTTRAVNPRG